MFWGFFTSTSLNSRNAEWLLVDGKRPEVKYLNISVFRNGHVLKLKPFTKSVATNNKLITVIA